MSEYLSVKYLCSAIFLVSFLSLGVFFVYPRVTDACSGGDNCVVDSEGHGSCQPTNVGLWVPCAVDNVCDDAGYEDCGDTRCWRGQIPRCPQDEYSQGYYQASYYAEGYYYSQGYYEGYYEGCYDNCGGPPPPPPGGPPTCTSTAPQATDTTATSGTFYVYAYGVANASGVFFPTWGNPNNQNDLVWYAGTNLGGGTWRASINLGNHVWGSPEYGLFNVHVYMNGNGYNNQFCGYANFTRASTPPLTCTSAAPQSPTTSLTSGTFSAYAYGVANATVVSFGVWGDTGGQDDLAWYAGVNTGGGTWRADINMANHKVGNPEYGNFNVHIYMGNGDGSYWPIWCGTANFTRTQNGTVQGYKLDQNYNPTLTPGATITVAGQTFGTGTNPYIATVASGVQTVTSSVPAGYSVAYSLCTNCYSHPPNSFVNGSSVNVTVPAGGYSDLYWRYTPIPADITTSNKDVVAVNGKTMVYHWDDGASEALITGTSPAEGGIVRFGVHIRNTSTAITSDIVVTDYFTNMVMPTNGWSASITCNNGSCATHTLDPTVIYNAVAKTATFTIHPNGGSLSSGQWITLFFNTKLQGPTGTTANAFRFINQADISYTENGTPKSVTCGGLSPCPLKTPATVFYRSLSSPGVEEVR